MFFFNNSLYFSDVNVTIIILIVKELDARSGFRNLNLVVTLHGITN